MGLFWESVLAFFAAVGVVQTGLWAWRGLCRRWERAEKGK